MQSRGNNREDIYRRCKEEIKENEEKDKKIYKEVSVINQISLSQIDQEENFPTEGSTKENSKKAAVRKEKILNIPSVQSSKKA